MKTALYLVTAPLACFLAASLEAEEPAANIDLPAIWKEHCASCHAADGSGETRIGRKLRLRSYKDPKVQSQLTDEEMLLAMKEGVEKNGRIVMGGYSQTLSNAEIEALLAYIRSMAVSE